MTGIRASYKNRAAKRVRTGYFSGSTWMAIIVPRPKRSRSRRSISTVWSCDSLTVISPSTRMCTSMAIEAPMRRVRRLWGSLTAGSAETMRRISSSVSAGSDCSSSSPRPERIRSRAILKIKTATTSAAIGSAIRHVSPRKKAQPMPTSVPSDESASLRWCQALATTLGLSIARPTRTV